MNIEHGRIVGYLAHLGSSLSISSGVVYYMAECLGITCCKAQDNTWTLDVLTTKACPLVLFVGADLKQYPSYVLKWVSTYVSIYLGTLVGSLDINMMRFKSFVFNI